MNLRPLALGAVALGALVGFALSFAPPAGASRNSSGTYSLPAGNPVSSGTTISSTWANNTLSDLSTEVTNSLDRNGRGAMTAPLQLASGTSAAPGLAFSGDTDSGFYRIGANDLALAAGATKAQEWTSTGTTVPVAATLTAGATVTQSTSNGNGLTTTGNGTGHGIVATGGSTNGRGVSATGNGTGQGVVGFGAAASTGTGVAGVGGSGGGLGGDFTAGIAATASARQDALRVISGDVAFSSTANPSSTTAITNRLTPTNLIKAWGHIASNTSTVVGVDAGFNLTGCIASASAITCTLASAMASNTAYAVLVTVGSGTALICSGSSASATTVTIGCRDTSGAVYNWTTSTPRDLSFMVLGAQ